MNKKVILIDMDHVLCDYDKAYYQFKKERPEIAFPQGAYGFFLNMLPIEGAIEAFQELNKNYDVCIVTRPSVYNPMSYSEKRAWVEKWLGLEACYGLILSYDKTMVRGDYLIDDNIHKHTGEMTGRYHPTWELLQFGSKEYPNWKAILNKFTKENV